MYIAYTSSKPESRVQSYAKHVQVNIVILFRYFEFKSASDKVREETTCLLIFIFELDHMYITPYLKIYRNKEKLIHFPLALMFEN